MSNSPILRSSRKASEDVLHAPPSMVAIGYGNLIAASRVIAVVSSQSAPMRRLRERAGQADKLIDATEGRRTRSILIMDSDHVVLSAINPETIASRMTTDEPDGGSV